MSETVAVRAALVGAGLVGQVAHLTTLTDPESTICLAAVVDASASRARVIGDAHGVPSAARLRDLDLSAIDAVVIATPDPTHASLISEALEAGLHVFCEKPLGISSDEASELARLAKASGRVCQVGYMKRFDPAVHVLLANLADHGETITGLAVEVRDPDAAPFVRDYPFIPAGDDIDPAPMEVGAQRFRDEVDTIIGRPASDEEVTAFGSFISALIHDLNVARMIVAEDVAVVHGFFSNGGLQVGMDLRTTSGVYVRMAHTQVPTIADYEERVIVYTTGGVYTLVFPAPYLLNAPTRLTYYAPKDSTETAEILELNDSTVEAFYEELQSFATAILAGEDSARSNTFDDAVVDLVLLERALRLACAD